MNPVIAALLVAYELNPAVGTREPRQLPMLMIEPPGGNVLNDGLCYEERTNDICLECSRKDFRRDIGELGRAHVGISGVVHQYIDSAPNALIASLIY